MNSLKFDLGIKELASEHASMVSSDGIREDVLAGLLVASVSLPLSLAIAWASGVNPGIGLTSAIVAGIVCALFGGTRLAISGPAAAMSILVASIVQQYGFTALLFVGLGCGILQLISGVLRWGKWATFVPMPVLAGFTAGIGAIIFIGQLPAALGLEQPDQSHVFDVISHLGKYIHETKPAAVGLSLLTFVLAFTIPRLSPRFPGALLAIAIPTAISMAMGLDVEHIGSLVKVLPSPSFPALPSENLTNLFGSTLMVFLLGSFETLFSASALERITKETLDSDQELIGQGLGNIAVALFGGIPVTALMVRSSINAQAGARTRRSAIIQSIFVLAFALAAAPLLGRIPASVLAGLLFSIAIGMVSPKEAIGLWRVSRTEAFVYAVTFLVIVFVDLMIGVQAGVGAALAVLAIRLGQTRARFHSADIDGPRRLTLEGPITFISIGKIASIRAQIETMDLSRGLVIDMARVTSIDASGAEQLVELVAWLRDREVRVVLHQVPEKVDEALVRSDQTGFIAQTFAVTESEVHQLLRGASGSMPIERLVYGVEKYRRELRTRYKPLFAKLADGQSPHTLFITCSDSRVNPNLITSTDPGELFIVRNVGNIVPPFGRDGMPAEGAAVEFAISVLGVQEIVVCGHSGCGAMKAILSRAVPAHLPSLKKWLSASENVLQKLPEDASPEQAAKQNALLQLENLKSYSIVAEKLAKNEIRLHAWFFDVGFGELEEWNEQAQAFVRLGEEDLVGGAGKTARG